jgi:hypothetical protein
MAAQPTCGTLHRTSQTIDTQSRRRLQDRTMNPLLTLVRKLGGNSDAPGSKRATPPSDGLHRTEWQLVAAQEPPPGSHLITRRRGYLHHGIYVGSGNVVHYAGLANGLRRGPVEEVPIARFARGQSVWVKSSSTPDFDCGEVIRRALSRLGEDCYRLLTNNCEHFCEWCLRGEPRSFQVEAWLGRPMRALRAAFQPAINSAESQPWLCAALLVPATELRASAPVRSD